MRKETEAISPIPYSPENLEKHVQWLSNVNPARNFINLDMLNTVAEYIAEEFNKAGANIEFQEFEVEGEIYKNVRGLFGPDSGERIVLGAHYDVCGDTPGADDNASAVAGLIALAHMLGKNTFTKTIECVAYTLEEPPFFCTEYMGSFKHAELLRRNHVQLRAMICLEMIGYFCDEKNSQDYPIPGMKFLYPSKGNFIGVVGRLADSKLIESVSQSMKDATDLPVEHLAAPSIVPGIAFSDHWSYWQHNYNAVMITDTSFYRNHNYHEHTDTPDTLDYHRMSKVVEGVYAAIRSLSA